MRKSLSSLIVLVVLLTSCMTSYEPRVSPRIATVIEGGSPMLLKDGQRYRLGPFGGELEEAVAPHPVAMDHAAAFRNQLIGGFALSLAGIVPIGIGAGMFANASASHQDSAVPIAVLTSGLLAYAVGLGLIVSAQPHMYDAINIYNDWVDAGMPAVATPTQ